MDWKSYVPLAIRTEAPHSGRIVDPLLARLNHAFTGLVTEFAELTTATRTPKLSITEHRAEEIGDLAWYTAIACDALHLEVTEDDYISPSAVLAESQFLANRDTLEVRLRGMIASVHDLEGALLKQTGDLGDLLKRAIYYGKPLNEVNAGQLVIGIYHTLVAFDPTAFPGILDRNIAKLRLRYPDRFDAVKAIDRDVNNEAKALTT